MDAFSARFTDNDDFDGLLASSDDRAVATAAASDAGWLHALPQAAAILAFREGAPSVLQANAAFNQTFPAGVRGLICAGDGEFNWTERIANLCKSRRASDHFEVRRDGPLGAEFLACTIGRLDASDRKGVRLLFTAIDRTNERVMEKNLRRELLSDSLTALPNRTGFGEEIDDCLANISPAERGSFAAIAIDLTRFSRVNESLGALAGDELIITVAKRLKSSLRRGDVLARIGGNEFAIFARLNNGLSDALHIVQRVNDALASPVRLTNLQISVECAIGCALSQSLADDPEDTVRQAQAAVKIAKRSGKLEIYRAGVLKEAHRRFTLESRLREAIAKGGLELAFQPLVHLESGDVTGFEALARWNDPELGEVSPSEFIPVAEESGLIVPLGRWAMYEAAQTLAKWDRVQGEVLPLGINVNLSPTQMSRDDVPTVVEEALRYSGIAGRRLTIELTESAIIADPDKARQVLAALKSLDASIAMDDFGTGYSNLASLQSLPIDLLKIDRSFVSNMIHDRDNHAIVRTILSLADSLDLRVTAEGIETQDLADVLQRLGCWQGQGYHFSQALSEQKAFDYWRARWNFHTI
ncbi:GGDEF-domain containing protein [Sphingobium sp. SCG-1]|uniref:putative bifunctional diguanylate cyclase/phosphodiesterase n=1 Tax=Sphingobium sp. SCG-1 TaxID=2072936 RepID=UPI000CD6A08B|nr:bifunctional diguanylate cyclase/phosphodiesterase [Sphingobium sp. SCG-1]AUW58084.1 GGDEF-domain containing protein [Sphingobium sp. SCG-1]